MTGDRGKTKLMPCIIFQHNAFFVSCFKSNPTFFTGVITSRVAKNDESLFPLLQLLSIAVKCTSICHGLFKMT